MSQSNHNQNYEVRTIESAPPSPSLNIHRYAYNLPQFNKEYDQISTHKTAIEKISELKPDLRKKTWTRRVKSLIPILNWLPKYDIKECLVADILVGFTIAIFQVPQSMGYSLIAHVNPVYGIYSSFFPSLLYTFLGSSMHAAFGAFAIVSLMTGNIVIALQNQLKNNDQFPDLENVDIAIMVAAIIGVYVLVCGILQLGFISNYMSEEFISGFMCSASVYVFATQLRYLLGVDYAYYSGPLALIKTFIDVFKRITEVHLATLTISVIALVILLVFKLLINPKTQKLGVKTPFPIELLIVIGGTLASTYLNLEEEYHVHVVGYIPNGFPAPKIPNLKLFQHMWANCIPVAFVAYIITASIAKIYGSKHGYRIDANQEMLAMGATNIFSCFFKCIPSAAALSRSALQDTAGGKTQIVSLVNCCCLVVVILKLGSLLENLPNCVLASCISVALVSLFAKMKEFMRFWKVSKVDSSIWMVTFISVIVLNVDLGTYIGLGYSVILLIYKSQRPKVYILGNIDKSDIYVPINKYKRAKEVEGVKIFQFCGPLNFANTEYFQNELELRTVVDIYDVKKKLKKAKNNLNVENSDRDKENGNQVSNSFPTHIIIDCSMFSYIDTTGIDMLIKIVDTFKEIEIITIMSGCQYHIETMLQRSDFFAHIPTEHVYHSVHDAVVFIKQENSEFGDENYDYNSVNLTIRSEQNFNMFSTPPLQRMAVISPPSYSSAPNSPKIISRLYKQNAYQSDNMSTFSPLAPQLAKPQLNQQTVPELPCISLFARKAMPAPPSPLLNNANSGKDRYSFPRPISMPSFSNVQNLNDSPKLRNKIMPTSKLISSEMPGKFLENNQISSSET